MARDSIQQCVTCVRLQGEFDDNVALQSTMCSFCLRSPSIEQLSVRNMGAGISNPNLASVHAMHRHPSEHPHRIVEEPANVPESPAHKDQMNAAAVATPDAQAPATSAPAPTVPSNAAPPAADAPVVGAEQTRPTEPTAEVLP